MAAGYSGTPLVGKLGIKPGHDVVLAGAPAGWSVDNLPDGVRIARRLPTRRVDLIVAFFSRLARLEKAVPDLAVRIVPDGAVWIAWPRRAGGHTSDITENDIRTAVLPLGLVDVKVAALDEDWSGLKVVWRKELRSGRVRSASCRP
ncbi:MAG TPA: DUF3052 domain-containing protein [Acidimicrobiales bacterium]|nr:DUF3052 domain-containing protein [Acidimicrobiales bacterium]